MGGRNGHPEKVLRIRYRSNGHGERKIKSRLVFLRSDKKRLVKGGRVLRIGKVGREEMTKTGEHNPMEKPEFLRELSEDRERRREATLFGDLAIGGIKECLPSR